MTKNVTYFIIFLFVLQHLYLYFNYYHANHIMWSPLKEKSLPSSLSHVFQFLSSLFYSQLWNITILHAGLEHKLLQNYKISGRNSYCNLKHILTQQVLLHKFLATEYFQDRILYDICYLLRQDGAMFVLNSSMGGNICVLFLIIIGFLNKKFCKTQPQDGT